MARSRAEMAAPQPRRPESARPDADDGRQRISRVLLVALAVPTILVGAIAAIGMLVSFHTVRTQMQPSFKAGPGSCRSRST